ncbi:MAG: homogentisate 1,2-dioxygenase, partial [Frankiaceae bacterium]|nr:homogentisate 1,2-dioxygenase [Frankiaceae bacterium]
MPYYRAVGEVPPKRHTQFRSADGGLYNEELMGVEGFSGESALLYHRGRPTAIVAAEPVDDVGRDTVANRPLLPRHFRTHELEAGGDLVRDRQLLLRNSDVRLLYAVATGPSELYRNATGDELVYVESGRATVETSFGSLEVGPGDYVALPTSTTHRWLPAAGDELRALI